MFTQSVFVWCHFLSTVYLATVSTLWHCCTFLCALMITEFDYGSAKFPMTQIFIKCSVFFTFDAMAWWCGLTHFPEIIFNSSSPTVFFFWLHLYKAHMNFSSSLMFSCCCCCFILKCISTSKMRLKLSLFFFLFSSLMDRQMMTVTQLRMN